MSTKKKVDVAQKYISCRQKQDDAASKKYFVHKKVAIYFPNRAPYTVFPKQQQTILEKHIHRSFNFNNIEAKEACNILNINEVQKQSPKSAL